MSTDKLIRMANQIAVFFVGYPDAEAVESIRDHIRRFWEPRMRKQLREYIEKGGEGLTPQVVTAFRDIQ